MVSGAPVTRTVCLGGAGWRVFSEYFSTGGQAAPTHKMTQKYAKYMAAKNILVEARLLCFEGMTLSRNGLNFLQIVRG